MFITLIITFQSQIPTSNSQQQYVNNLQLSCNTNNNDNTTLGFVCNGLQPTCTSYLTFRSDPPSYATPETIATLLSTSASDIARLNNITESDPIPAGNVVVVPVTCNCTSTGGNRYYQHNARYKLRALGEIYLSIANNTYQGLTTCQAMMGQNRYQATDLLVGDEFLVPIRCACPTAEQQRKYGARFLIYYVVNTGDDLSHIADMFRVSVQSILDANELLSESSIFPFSPLLVPLQTVPKNINFSLSSSQSATPQTNPVIISTTTSSGSGGSSKKWVFVVIGIGGAGILVLLVLFLFFFLRPIKTQSLAVSKEKNRTKKDPELPASYQNSKSWSVTLDGLVGSMESLTAYKFTDLEKATGKFSDACRIKGSVFRGEFNGDEAAIKILKGSVASDEINLLKIINHSNIIRLSGYCIHRGNTYMVYEFAEKGSLDIWIQSQAVLGWTQRVQIAYNVADALNYLHSYVNPPYIHKNLKSSNIILDANYRAKITNFGLARTVEVTDENGELQLTKHVIGTHGYMAPEYIENGVVTTKLDVFAFGVVVLELLSGKPAVIQSDNLLFGLIRKVFEGGNVRDDLMSFMDGNLGGDYPLDLAYLMAELAYNCVNRDMNSRPSMSEVSMALSKIYSSSLES